MATGIVMGEQHPLTAADVMRGASLVVCHGGSGTVFGALAAGIPLVCVPPSPTSR
jgi:UDP:flavonoid glycosyltransferase YjiC (YdhE family)